MLSGQKTSLSSLLYAINTNVNPSISQVWIFYTCHDCLSHMATAHRIACKFLPHVLLCFPAPHQARPPTFSIVRVKPPKIHELHVDTVLIAECASSIFRWKQLL